MVRWSALSDRPLSSCRAVPCFLRDTLACHYPILTSKGKPGADALGIYSPKPRTRYGLDDLPASSLWDHTQVWRRLDTVVQGWPLRGRLSGVLLLASSGPLRLPGNLGLGKPFNFNGLSSYNLGVGRGVVRGCDGQGGGPPARPFLGPPNITMTPKHHVTLAQRSRYVRVIILGIKSRQ